ncbi:LOW QUALITY PROTEIN: putative disease resistance RPP13-like protein 1 [Jatropha curcas]|uniref:LOW QUALITY PROTEIN: putative disease resistance RPP13-like protein 1 n=1 Tax=Jatropha curcas TaxID=180498 RepID=UPI001894574E|nr:LOW QUALITY PROTEIN: putative disease resistance RPP13-like protein 1 [Jatropha curcas]
MDIAIAIGGALLAPAFKSLFNKLGSQDLLNYARKRRVLTQINKWKEMLERIDGVLEDAEEKQMESRSVKMWVSDLRKLAYDLEDILDEFDFEARRSKLKAKPMTGSSRVRKLTPNIRAVKFNKKLISKIKATTPRLEEITSRRNELDLSERPVKLWERIPATCLVNHAEIYGREKDKKAILELLNSESSDRRVALISIVGMGGIGKTTLTYNVVRLTKTVLQSVGGDLTSNDLNSLQLNLKARLSEKKFFMVLDDVWNENYDHWRNFLLPFENGAKESRIIVTTRNLGVSRTMGAIQSYTLRVLENDDCLSVFAHHALGVTNFEEHLDLEAIGKKIVERCQGLPLAAKAIGGLLRGQSTRDAWEQVLNSRIWEEKSDILPALKLSYHHLPSHLKQCFAYCAIFPKGYEFDEDELVLSGWQRDLYRTHKMKEMKGSGHRYFQDLLLRSFFQQSTYNESRYVMHDLLNDLAKSVSGEICLHLDDDELKGIKSHANVRHSAFTCHRYERYQRFEDFYEMSNLRTFLALSTDRWRGNFLSIRVVHDLVPKLKRLRVLSLARYQFEELPSSIGALKHLRYLDLSYNTGIIRFSTRNVGKDLQMANLVDLKEDENLGDLALGMDPHLWIFVHFCSQLIHLWRGSTNLDKLSSLKSLQIEGCQKLVSLVGGEEGNLPCNLEILVIRECDGLEILPNGLQTLTSLREMNIQRCRNLVSFPSAGLPCSLKSLKIVKCDSLESLPKGIVHDSNARNEMSHLEVVGVNSCPSLTSVLVGEFPYSIKKIAICFWTTQLLESFHNRFSESFHNRFSHLTTLIIYGSELESFPESGLAIPNLRDLIIRKCENLRLLPNQIQNLTSLLKLAITNCAGLVSFSDEGLPPNLTYLFIWSCENLRFLPNQMQNLTSLQRLLVSNCGGLVSFPDGGLPPKLGSLTISRCKKLKQPMSEWILNRLTSLTIRGPCPSTDMDSFPEEKGLLLPSSLTSLKIEDFKNLKSISRGIHHLTSLDTLVIRKCPKLQSFPKEGLPSTLERLAIFECPLLERRCRKEKGDYWRFIANIPYHKIK